MICVAGWYCIYKGKHDGYILPTFIILLWTQNKDQHVHVANVSQ